MSDLAKSLDATVARFRERALDGGPYPYVWLDATMVRCRDDGRIVNVAVLIVVGVNAEGKREILGVDVVTAEAGAGWRDLPEPRRDHPPRGRGAVRSCAS